MLEGLDHPFSRKMEIVTFYKMAKRLVFLNKLEISRALLAFLRIFTNSYSTLWAPQNDILK